MSKTNNKKIKIIFKPNSLQREHFVKSKPKSKKKKLKKKRKRIKHTQVIYVCICILFSENPFFLKFFFFFFFFFFFRETQCDSNVRMLVRKRK